MSDAAAQRLICAGTFRAAKGVSHPVMKAMEAMATASRGEDGCEEYAYARDVFDPTLIRVFEVWRDEASFRAHRGAPHLTAWRAKWPDLGLGEANLSTYWINTHEKL
jgi:quinol monooxygenase YgiN